MGGVEIETLKEGDGANFPKAGQKVSCHYVLTLTNGKKIDSSRDRGSAFEFNIGRGEVSVDICDAPNFEDSSQDLRLVPFFGSNNND